MWLVSTVARGDDARWVVDVNFIHFSLCCVAMILIDGISGLKIRLDLV